MKFGFEIFCQKNSGSKKSIASKRFLCKRIFLSKKKFFGVHKRFWVHKIFRSNFLGAKRLSGKNKFPLKHLWIKNIFESYSFGSDWINNWGGGGVGLMWG